MLRILRSNKAVSPITGMVLILAIAVTARGIIFALGVLMIDSVKESTAWVTRMQLGAGFVRACGANGSLSNSTGYREYKATSDAEVQLI
jgi:hypothetical protein